jgi:hypothetical protein
LTDLLQAVQQPPPPRKELVGIAKINKMAKAFWREMALKVLQMYLPEGRYLRVCLAEALSRNNDRERTFFSPRF